MTINRYNRTRIPAPSRVLLLILFLACALPVVPARAQDADDLATRAGAALQASEWDTARQLYGKLTRATPADPTAWYRLGVATARSGGDGKAVRAAFEKALELGMAPGPALLGLARSHAADGQPAASVAALERLAQQGPAPFVVSQLRADETFTSLADDKTFQGVLVRLTPCTSAEYRQFDFWLGNWNVVGPQGQTLGTNEVTQSMDGCLLMENWESAGGGQKGMSINYYDRDKGTWSQIYRDNSGNITRWPELVGGLVDGAMVLDSGPDTQPRARWTWAKESEGRVRQVAERTTDGENWATVWDSFYVPAGD